jgi:putative acetyltransferase
MKIKVDDLSGSKIAELLRAHLRSLSALSPPESMHALNIDGLRRPEVTFWSAWEGEELMGCGALKELDPQHAEIKSMRTAAAHLRKGVASAMLEHIISEAKRRNYRKLSLETGAGAPFEPARRLYSKFGFKRCGAFVGYVEDPTSGFLTREV